MHSVLLTGRDSARRRVLTHQIRCDPGEILFDQSNVPCRREEERRGEAVGQRSEKEERRGEKK
jgi:hypothetical protein